MNEQVRLLLEETQTRSAILQQDLVKVESKVLEEDLKECIERLFDLRQVLTPLEIDIRQLELQLKKVTKELPNSEEYMEKYTAIKAREAQAVIDTVEIKENILKLKLERNKLRDRVEYFKYYVAFMIAERC